MKRFLLLLFIFLLLCACNSHVDPAGKSYLYEGEGFGGEFSIQIKEDGSFSYYEGMLSSYIGIGTWAQKNNILILKDESYDIINHFIIDEDSLRFVEENSSNFIYVQLKDGAVFKASSEE